MAQIDDLNPLSLQMMMAHELSHAIDPCTLEEAAFEDGQRTTSPLPFEKAFPGLIKCLRGGADPDGCGKNAKLSCPQPKPEISQCREMKESPSDLQECEQKVQFTPHCPNPYLERQFEKSGHKYQAEPIRESVPDALAAEVTARLLQAKGPLTSKRLNENTDALASFTSWITSFNPSGKSLCDPTYHVTNGKETQRTRINRLIMGNTAFRKAMGCPANTGTDNPASKAIDCTAF